MGAKVQSWVQRQLAMCRQHRIVCFVVDAHKSEANWLNVSIFGREVTQPLFRLPTLPSCIIVSSAMKNASETMTHWFRRLLYSAVMQSDCKNGPWWEFGFRCHVDGQDDCIGKSKAQVKLYVNLVPT